jgi:hypothetical protein
VEEIHVFFVPRPKNCTNSYVELKGYVGGNLFSQFWMLTSAVKKVTKEELGNVPIRPSAAQRGV